MPRARGQPTDIGRLDRHMDFQRREWRVQHLAWWALVVLVTAAAAGLFGNGPLSRARAESAGGEVRLEYERFLRAGASHRLVVRAPSPGRAAPLELRVNRGYLDRMRIERVMPAPSVTTVGPDWATFRFDTGTTDVIVECEPLDSGRHALTLVAGTGAPLRVWQFAYF